jgi:polyadenylate-binding protein
MFLFFSPTVPCCCCCCCYYYSYDYHHQHYYESTMNTTATTTTATCCCFCFCCCCWALIGLFQVVTNPQGQSKGFGFVSFADPACAEEAISKCNGTEISGQAVSVEKFVPKRDRPSNQATEEFTNVYVRDLPENCNEDQLRELFGKFGTITACNFKQTNQGRTFAFVNFESPEAAVKVRFFFFFFFWWGWVGWEWVDLLLLVFMLSSRYSVVSQNARLSSTQAIEEMNDKEIDGRRLHCSRAQKRPERLAALRRQYDERRRDQDLKTQRLNIYVKNLGPEASEEKLRELFAPFGNVTSAKVSILLFFAVRE